MTTQKWQNFKPGKRVVWQTEDAPIVYGTVIRRDRRMIVIRYDGQHRDTMLVEGQYCFKMGWLQLLDA